MGEGRIKIFDKILKRGKYADKKINSANDYVQEDLKKKEKEKKGLRCGGKVHKMKAGGMLKKCKRDGVAVRGKTRAQEIIMATTQEIFARLNKQKEGNYGTRKSGEDLKNKPDFTKTNVKSDKKAETKKTETKKVENKKTETKSTTSFGTAFANARKAGKKTFMWNGKSYHTRRADDKPATKPSKPGTPNKSNAPNPYTKPNKPTVVKEQELKAKTKSTPVEKKDSAKPKTMLDKAKNAIGMNRPAAEKEKMGRNLQRNAQKSMGFKCGGSVKAHRGDGICKKGKTKGRFV